MLSRRHRRQNTAIVVIATVLGLWWGVTAPSVSPVTPPAAIPAGVAPAISQG